MNNAMDSGGVAQATPIRDIIITRFSIIAFCVRLVGCVALIVASWWLMLQPVHNPKDAIGKGIAAIFAICYPPVFLWMEGVVLRE